MLPPGLLILGGIGSAVGAALFVILAARAYRRRAARAFPRRQAGGAAAAAQEAAAPGEGKGGLSRFGAMLRPSDEAALEQLRNKLVQAGLYGRDAVDLYLTVRLTVIISCVVLFALFSSAVESFAGTVFMLVGFISLAVVGPSLWLDLRTNRRKLEISSHLPSTLDLLVTCLDAGLNLEQALTRVAAESRFGDDLLSRELRITLEEIRAGLSTAVAFQRLATRLGHEEVQNLAALVAQAARLGANLGDALRAHSTAIRNHRIVFLEEQAGKANAKLTLPLTICLLPAVMILLLGPAIVMMAKSF